MMNVWFSEPSVLVPFWLFLKNRQDFHFPQAVHTETSQNCDTAREEEPQTLQSSSTRSKYECECSLAVPTMLVVVSFRKESNYIGGTARKTVWRYANHFQLDGRRLGSRHECNTIKAFIILDKSTLMWQSFNKNKTKQHPQCCITGKCTCGSIPVHDVMFIQLEVPNMFKGSVYNRVSGTDL